MKFEEQITVLCAEAVGAKDEHDVRRITSDLRLVLHRHIERLRFGVVAAYRKSLFQSRTVDETLRNEFDRTPDSLASAAPPAPPRKWQEVVHEIATERDHAKALVLSQELNRLMQKRPNRIRS